MGPLPVIFILLSSTKIYGRKGMSHVLNYFAMHFLTKMEQFYISGVEIEYAYNPELISPLLENTKPRYIYVFHIVTGFNFDGCYM
jgi:hypothetical protein